MQSDDEILACHAISIHVPIEPSTSQTISTTRNPRLSESTPQVLGIPGPPASEARTQVKNASAVVFLHALHQCQPSYTPACSVCRVRASPCRYAACVYAFMSEKTCTSPEVDGREGGAPPEAAEKDTSYNVDGNVDA
jgi:hypothetical protein